MTSDNRDHVAEAIDRALSAILEARAAAGPFEAPSCPVDAIDAALSADLHHIETRTKIRAALDRLHNQLGDGDAWLAVLALEAALNESFTATADVGWALGWEAFGKRNGSSSE